MPMSHLSLSRIPLPRTSLRLTDAARRWSVSTQARARRNAMVALTSLAERRAEREDADAYLEAAAHRRAHLPLPGSRRSAGGS
jgi:hypothetical protein